MLPLSVEYAIREAVALLRASQKHFTSKDVAKARALLEQCLEGLPERKTIAHSKKWLSRVKDKAQMSP